MTAKTSQGVPFSSVRAYRLAIEALRDRINSGRYPVGEWLPAERILEEDLKVDRRVVRAAVNQLVQEGLVERQPHCRPVVIRAKHDIPEANDSDAASRVRDPLSPSNFVALIMWYGGGILEPQTSQQRIFWGVNQSLANAGYHAVFLDLGHIGEEKENAEREAGHLRYVMERGFGGAIFYPYAYRSNQDLVQEVMRQVPLVMIDRRIAPLQTDFVCTANHKAMYDTVMHLVHQGHRRIAYLTKYEPIQPVEDRIQGYIDAVNEAGIEEFILTIPSGNSGERDWTVVDSVFRLPKGERPTAAAAYNDYAACEFLDHLEHIGLSVPDDVALTGFDNIVPSLQTGLGLTTVAQPYEEIGMNAAQLLLRRLKDPAAAFQSVELPARLIVRESSSYIVEA